METDGAPSLIYVIDYCFKSMVWLLVAADPKMGGGPRFVYDPASHVDLTEYLREIRIIVPVPADRRALRISPWSTSFGHLGLIPPS